MFKSVLGFFGKVGGKSAPNNGPELAMILEQLGFFSGLSKDAAAALASEIAISPFACMDHPLRVFHTDAENLAEAGVGDWLTEVAVALKGRGVDLGSVEENQSEDGEEYHVKVKGRDFTIFTRAESTGSNSDYCWAYAFSRTLMLVNVFLSEAGSSDRFHGYFGTGNDGFAWLITPEQAEAINRLLEFQPQERLILMTDTPPLFGITLNE
jgi:hypothetical protein